MDNEPLRPFPGVYHIPTPGGVCVTLLAGEHRALLVDTGLGLIDLDGLIRSLTPLPLTVVNTHGHNDHIAGNFQFDRVFLHPADLPCARFALSGEIRRRVCGLLECEPADRDGYWGYQLENIHPLDSRARFDLGGLTAQIIPLPTHTPGSVGVFCPEYGLLLTGDALAPLVYLFFPESCGLSGHIALIRRIERLAPRWLLASHCPRLLPGAELALYRRCAAAYDPARTRPYHDPFFPTYPGRQFIYQESGPDPCTAFLICKPSEGSYEKSV